MRIDYSNKWSNKQWNISTALSRFILLVSEQVNIIVERVKLVVCWTHFVQVNNYYRIGATTIMLFIWKKIKIFQNFISLLMKRVYFIRRLNRAWSQRTLNNKLYASITNSIYIPICISLIWFGFVWKVYSLRVDYILVS